MSQTIFNNSFSTACLDIGGIEFEIPIEIEPAPKEYFISSIGKRPSKPLLDHNARKTLENYDTMENKLMLYAGILKLSSELCITHMGGEPCFEVEEIVERSLGGKKVIFSGYSDAVAYIPTDKLIPEGGYEVDSFLEYGFKGQFKIGVDNKIFEAFRAGGEKLFGNR